jgi:hypothetical protein
MPVNHVLLETIELTQSAASVTFDNIPQTGYTDLKLVISARTTRAEVTDAISLSFNGVATNQTSRYIEGVGSGNPGSNALTSFRTQATGATATANAFGNSEFYIPDYAGSTFKSASSDGVSENNATSAYAWIVSNLWSSTAAITSISVTNLNSANFVANSTFSLYGIAATGTTPVTAPKAQGGNIVANDGTYWYHAFLASGTFTPNAPLTCDVLQIAGGGAGGLSSASAGGGGAGGVSYIAATSVSTSTAVTVGAGGTGGISTSGSYAYASSPSVGNNSQFGSLTAAVSGGLGGGYGVGNGASGGSGGGGSTNSGTGGAGTAGQGNNGGLAGNGGNYYSGGGGGAGAAGGAGTSGLAVGGVGTSAYSSWGLATSTGQNVSGTVFFAGGGGGSSNGAGGGAGGNGGGGQGATANKVAATNGTSNTGGGGGAGSNTEAFVVSGASGGSGIVIIRYAMA